MNDHLPGIRFSVEGNPGPLMYMEDPDVVPDQPSPAAPSSVIPSAQTITESSSNPDLGDDAVFPMSATFPLLRRRQYIRMERVHSAPTLTEHEVGLALRNISDDFNNNYNQVRADRTRRASHPETNNHHSHGVINSLMRQFSGRSRTSSHQVYSRSASEAGVVHSPVIQPGSSRLSQRTSVQSVPEEDEEAVDAYS